MRSGQQNNNNHKTKCTWAHSQNTRSNLYERAIYLDFLDTPSLASFLDYGRQIGTSMRSFQWTNTNICGDYLGWF